MAEAAARKRDPHVDIPARSLSNVRYNKQRRFIEMGRNTNRRQLFNLSQAKSYMQTMLVASGVTQLIEQEKTTSIRGLFYLLKHTIEGTKEETFSDQDECDPVIEDCEVLLEQPPRGTARLCEQRGAHGRRNRAARLGRRDQLRTNGFRRLRHSLDRRAGSDPVKKCDAKFVLHVEKDTVWRRFNEDKFWRKHKCILTHGMGQPRAASAGCLHRLHNELKLPVYCLLDNDPWGYYIYSVIKQGSINLAYESQRMAIPDAKFLGLRSKDYQQCQLLGQRQDSLNDTDRKRAKQIASYPWFAHKKEWQKEIKRSWKTASRWKSNR